MQRTLCLIFAVLLLLSLCACENALGRNPQFAFVHSAEEDSYFRALAYSFTAAATELGYECTVVKPENDTAEAQVALIEDLIEQGVKGIALNANQMEGLEDALKKAEDAGIPVVTVGRDTKGSLLYIQPSSMDLAGQALMEAVYDLTYGEGTFVVLSGEYPFSGFDAWVNCMGLAARDSKYQKLNWAETNYSFDSTGSTEDMMALLVQLQEKYPDLEVICCPGPQTLLACSKAIAELGMDIKATGMFMEPGKIPEFVGEDKPCPYFLTWNSSEIGRCVAYALEALINGASLEAGGTFTTKLGEYPLQNGYADHLQIVAGPPLQYPLPTVHILPAPQ